MHMRHGVGRTGTHTVARTLSCNTSDATRVYHKMLGLAPDTMQGSEFAPRAIRHV